MKELDGESTWLSHMFIGLNLQMSEHYTTYLLSLEAFVEQFAWPLRVRGLQGTKGKHHKNRAP